MVFHISRDAHDRPIPVDCRRDFFCSLAGDSAAELITFTFTELAAGDTQYKVHEAARNDEIGELGRAYGNFRRIVLDAEANRVKMREQEESIEAARKRVETEKAQAEAQKSEALWAMIEQVDRETKVAVNSVIDLMEELTTITSDCPAPPAGSARPALPSPPSRGRR